MTMNVKKIHLMIAVLFAGLVLLGGCKKSEPASPATPAATTQGHEGQEHAAASTEPAKENVAAAEQTTCPIMGGAIDKNIFTEYKGKKVYFCCAGCKEQFEKEPEKYIAKLPQFQQ
jgi:YHS domain-containing protein